MVQVDITPNTLAAFAEQDEVVAILPNQKIRILRPKAEAYNKLSRYEKDKSCTWGLQRLGILELWKTTKGKDISIGVLDTGVHGEHPALAGQIRKFVLIDPIGRRITTSNTFDSGRHGTHVCGTIAGGKTTEGVSIGVAPEAKMLVAAVLIGDATLRSLLEGMSWAVENGVDIINMSLGFSYYEPLFDEVFKILIDQFGVLPVAAIGNENYGNSSSPGNALNALSVGALGRTRGRGIGVASFSSGASLVFPGQEPDALVTKPRHCRSGSGGILLHTSGAAGKWHCRILLHGWDLYGRSPCCRRCCFAHGRSSNGRCKADRERNQGNSLASNRKKIPAARQPMGAWTNPTAGGLKESCLNGDIYEARVTKELRALGPPKSVQIFCRA
jgi:hypothetical protein